jgi:formylmethanofuran dehydrogenase subunit E
MPSKNRASFRGRECCDRCGQEWFCDELKTNPKGRRICPNCWDDNEGED